jgi:hypothetical protein
MSRTTQYIGLTDDARDYLKKHATAQELYEMTTGMFNEAIGGNIYDLPVPNGPNKRYYAKEVVQAEPWSSGPMIFTCLELFLEKDCGQVINHGRIFQWVDNPGLHGEYDPKKGHKWV